jgi:hypothetical protein
VALQYLEALAQFDALFIKLDKVGLTADATFSDFFSKG